MDRQSWSHEHVRSLIAVWAQEDVQQKMDGVCRNEDVMKHIAAELAKLGILRTTQQIREKLKKLRAQYKSIKLHNSGSDVHPKKFPFFDVMDSVLGQRSSVRSSTARDSMSFQEADEPQGAESACSIKPSESVSSPASCSSASSALDETTNPEGSSLLITETSPAPVVVKPWTAASHLTEASHQIPPRSRAEPRRKPNSQLDFIAAMKEIADKDREAERELRLQEAKMEEQLRREEMAQMEQMAQERSRETRELMALLATLLPQKPQD